MTTPPQRIADLDGGDPMPDEPMTELGYAHRLVHVYGGRLRCVPAWKRWLMWDGQRWAHDTTGQAPRCAKTIARRLTAAALEELARAATALRAAVTAEDAGAAKDAKAALSAAQAAVSAAKKGESAHAIAGVLTLAGTEPGIVVTPDDLDADPFLLNCTNGTLDLRTGKLRDHNPADLLTKMTGAAYRPDAAGPEFTKFLDRVQPDQAMREYLARLFGHGLEGRVTEHLLQIHCGAGANGKSTLIDVMQLALGDYAAAADPELLTAKTFDAHPTGTADLFGLRLAVLHESDRGRRLAEGTVKRLTGGDRVKARRMREDFWSFAPSHTFVMLSNHKPVVGGTDEGIWRRLRLVPWDVIIPPKERDEHLGDRLALEQDAVLAFLVAGYRDWRKDGLRDPEAVTTATASYRNESDALKRFIDQKCMTGPNFTAPSSGLFAAWCKWCDAEGEEHGSQTAFSLALTNRGYDKRPTMAGKVWKGIGIENDAQ